MTQVGDMFNTSLRARVDALRAELAAHVRAAPAGIGNARPIGAAREMAWWPAALGRPDVTGGQNDLRYAWFAPAGRLVVDRAGVVTTYDTRPHHITGVAQAQDPRGTRLTFSTADGAVDLASLPVVRE
jgi:hypothetical protein